jgi:hypothetical protein
MVWPNAAADKKNRQRRNSISPPGASFFSVPADASLHPSLCALFAESFNFAIEAITTLSIVRAAKTI